MILALLDNLSMSLKHLGVASYLVIIYDMMTRSGIQFRSCVNREVGLIPYPILPPSLISRTVSVDVKHHESTIMTT